MQAFRSSGRFVGRFDSPPTFSTEKPDRCIDYILAPRSWTLVRHRVLKDDISDHLPVVSTFALP
jgi:endonuclease/exonuclease/phosphatase (EEP) superfamily protein YafD